MHDSSTAVASPTIRPLSVTYKPTQSIAPDPRNARTHPKRQIAQIVASIEAFGFTNPILVDEAGTIIAGHGRLRAARETGLAEVPTIEIAGLSDPQKRVLSKQLHRHFPIRLSPAAALKSSNCVLLLPLLCLENQGAFGVAFRLR